MVAVAWPHTTSLDRHDHVKARVASARAIARIARAERVNSSASAENAPMPSPAANVIDCHREAAHSGIEK